ncbi:MAG: hypothetical protein F6J87_19210 [Spirulina sp. SIO3F2]|nr:hypothetical protein [Spirulina sp. SIO3F2]
MSETEHSPGQALNSAPDPAAASSRFEQTSTSTTSEANTSVQEADWFTLARKLRQRNRELLKRVADLEQALAQMQEELDGEAPRPASVASLGLLPPDAALHNAQTQVDTLCKELEESHSVAQRQQFLIESLTQQLDATQTQLKHWEREHLAAQQRHHQQVELLAQATENSQVLNRQLERQQAQAAQFKTTLAECFAKAEATASETPSSSLASAPSKPSVQPTAVTPPPIPSTPAPATQTPKTIQPWSANHAVNDTTATPSWATRLLGSEQAETPTTATNIAAKSGIQSHLPVPRSAPAGKFANLLLPAFNDKTEAAPAPKILREPATPVTPVAPPTLNPPSRARGSIAAVDLPTFPRQP